MHVTIMDAMAVGPTNRIGEIFAAPNRGFSSSGINRQRGITIREGDFNPERIQIDDGLFDGANPEVSAGDRLGNVTGVVSYAFGNFEALPSKTPTVTQRNLRRERTRLLGTRSFATVATVNVENLDPGDGPRFDDLADIIVNNLRSPDILGLQEVQDDSGPANDGVVSADLTYQLLIDSIVAAGGPLYEFREIDPEDGQDGGQPGGNIRVGFLFNSSRVSFVDRGNAGPTDSTQAIADGNGLPALTLNPGRIDPTNPAFDDSRKSLVGQFTFRGRPLFVIVNHFRSKGGSSPLFGSVQPAINGGEDQRNQMAQVVNDFVDSLLEISPGAKVVVLGDMNEFQFFEPLQTLAGQSLFNLTNTLRQCDRYTFIFEGNSQALDHLLITPSLRWGARYDIVHVNAAFSDQASDHDPCEARVRP